jgi:hypothetical protein
MSKREGVRGKERPPPSEAQCPEKKLHRDFIVKSYSKVQNEMEIQMMDKQSDTMRWRYS